MNDSILPSRGVVFWPVGTGDSTTIIIDDEHVMQVDLHDMASADDDDNPHVPLIDRLAESLPLQGGRPYLSVFALTHADQDHCRGFGDLLDSDILIGELWATPRLWRENAEEAEMCADARRFHREADRRVIATLEHIAAGRAVPSGDRIRVIGYDEDFEENSLSYGALPAEQVSFPGDVVTTVDGVDVAEVFEAFIHAPFKGDCAGERNETSLAMQVTLMDGAATGRVLLFGDLSYSTLRKIFDLSKDERLAWDVLLAPHHCSKGTMYVRDANGQDVLQQDILDDLDRVRADTAWVVSSSDPVPVSNSSGDNPPHARAKRRYLELGIEAFVCTQEHGGTDAPVPVVCVLDPSEGLQFLPPGEKQASKALGAVVAGATTLAAVGAAVRQARRSDAAPVAPVGFGALDV